jgi:hypothetical protein
LDGILSIFRLLKNIDLGITIALIDKLIFYINKKRKKVLPKISPTKTIFIGLLIKDRPRELRKCLDSLLFSLRSADNFDVRIFLFDDGSTDIDTLSILNSTKTANPSFGITLLSRKKSNNSWSDAHNWAVSTMLKHETENTLIGTCDSDVIFTPNWISDFVEWCNYLRNCPKNRAINFSAFNSNQTEFHRVIREAQIAGYKYLEKHRVGGVHLFSFSQDLRIKGPFKRSISWKGRHLKNFDDESRETRKLNIICLLNATLVERHFEHQISESLLDKNRPVALSSHTFALNLPNGDWFKAYGLDRDSTLGLIQSNPVELHDKSAYASVTAAIPVGVNDLSTVHLAVSSLQSALEHELKMTYLITSTSFFSYLKQLNLENVTLIDERDILEPDKYRENSSWIYQQFLKWSTVLYLNTDTLVVDADTLLFKAPRNNFQLYELNVDENVHRPYRFLIEDIFGFFSEYPYSFVTHSQLINLDILKALINVIEERLGSCWLDGITNRLKFSSNFQFSEYDTYGLFAERYYRNRLIINYAFNISLGRKYCTNIQEIREKFSKKCNSVSYHWYLPKNYYPYVGWRDISR